MSENMQYPPSPKPIERPHCLGCGQLQEFCPGPAFNPPAPFSVFFQQTVASELREGDEILVDQHGLCARVLDVTSKNEDEVCLAVAGKDKATTWRLAPGEIVVRRMGTPADSDVRDALSQFWVLFYVGEDGRCALCGNSGYITHETAGEGLQFRETLCFCPNGRSRRSQESPS